MNDNHVGVLERATSEEHPTQEPIPPEKVQLEKIALDPIPSVGLLGLDKGSWHCGGGMGGL